VISVGVEYSRLADRPSRRNRHGGRL